jgi:uncharacterized membrane protein
VTRRPKIHGHAHNEIAASRSRTPHSEEVRLSFHNGPLPSPEQIERYEQVLPGAAEIIFRNFESQVEHRQNLEKKVIEANVRAQAIAPFLGTFLAALVIVGGFWVVIAKGDATGYAAILGAGAGLVGTALYVRKAQTKERLEKEKALTRG